MTLHYTKNVRSVCPQLCPTVVYAPALGQLWESWAWFRCSWWTLRCLRIILVELFSALVCRVWASSFTILLSHRPARAQESLSQSNNKTESPNYQRKVCHGVLGHWQARSAASSLYLDLFWDSLSATNSSQAQATSIMIILVLRDWTTRSGLHVGSH